MTSFRKTPEGFLPVSARRKAVPEVLIDRQN